MKTIKLKKGNWELNEGKKYSESKKEKKKIGYGKGSKGSKAR